MPTSSVRRVLKDFSSLIFSTFTHYEFGRNLALVFISILWPLLHYHLPLAASWNEKYFFLSTQYSYEILPFSSHLVMFFCSFIIISIYAWLHSFLFVLVSILIIFIIFFFLPLRLRCDCFFKKLFWTLTTPVHWKY